MQDPAARRRARRATRVDEAAVRAANRAFYDAFEARDLDAMSDVWEHADRVSCTHPGWRTLHGLGRGVGLVVRPVRRPEPAPVHPHQRGGLRGGRRRVGDRGREPHQRRRRRHGGGDEPLRARRGALAAASPTTARRWRPRPDERRPTTLQPPCKKLLPPTAGRCGRCAPARPSSTPRSGCSRRATCAPPRHGWPSGRRCPCGASSSTSTTSSAARGGGRAPRRAGGGARCSRSPRTCRSTCASTGSCTSGPPARGGHAHPPRRRRPRSVLHGDHRPPARRPGVPARGAGASPSSPSSPRRASTRRPPRLPRRRARAGPPGRACAPGLGREPAPTPSASCAASAARRARASAGD